MSVLSRDTNGWAPNGEAQLLDHNGRPFPKNRPDGSAQITGIAIPNALQIIARNVGGIHDWWQTQWDEAMRRSREDALSMRRDAWLQSIVNERRLAVYGLNWSLKVPDEKDPAQIRVRDNLQANIKGIPHLRRIFWWLTDAVWYGRYASQVEWGWQPFTESHQRDKNEKKGGPGEPRRNKKTGQPESLTIMESWPVLGDVIGSQEDNTPIIYVNPAESDRLQNTRGYIGGTTLGMLGLPLRGTWRERFIIHRHLIEPTDPFNPEQAGSLAGTGIRSACFWSNYLRLEFLGNISNFFDRVGLGMTVWKYPRGNAEALAAAKQAALDNSERAHIFVPVDPDGSKGAGSEVERIEVPTSGSESLLGLVEKLETNIERYIVGQEGSSSATSSSGHSNQSSSQFMQSCVPINGSEILTRDGFKSPHNVVIGEEVLAYDVEADCCRWTPLLNKTFYSDRPVSRLYTGNRDGSGPAGRVCRFEAICTADHSWATEQTRFLRRLPEDGGVGVAVVRGHRGALKPAQQNRKLLKSSEIRRSDNVILAAPENGTDDSLLTPTEAAILGWLVTDGTLKRVGNSVCIGICQSKEEHFPAIRELVGAAALSVKELVSRARVRTFPNGRTYPTKEQHWWYLPSGASRNLLEKCRFVSRQDLLRIVTRLSQSARGAMLEAMIAADGSRTPGKDGCQFYNTDPFVLEAFEILCALQGVATGKTTSHQNSNGCYIKRAKRTRYAYGNYLHLEDAGRADIWCPTTRFGTWVMRQHGRVMITGNTKENIVRFDAENLAVTLTGTPREPGLVNVIKRHTYPKADFPVWLEFSLEATESQEKLQAAKILGELNVPVKQAEVLAAAGFSKPVEGDEVVKPPQPQQPGGGPPGAPGGTPGGDNPLAAMMGGAGGGEGGPPGAVPPGGEAGQQQPQGDLLEALRQGRDLLEAIRYERERGERQEKEKDEAEQESSQPKKKHKYSTTHVLLPDDLADKVHDLAATIPDSILAGDGKDVGGYHTTCRYGLHGDDPAPVIEALQGIGPIRLKLGKTAVFPASESSDGADVVHIQVDSPDLHRINKLLAEKLPHRKDKFPRYQPHCTLGYVAPGKGKRWHNASHPLEGREVVVEELVFATPEGEETVIPLRGEEEEVLCHVAGPSGSGKTTLAGQLRRVHPDLMVRDLDDFDDAAVALLGWVEVPKKDFTDGMLEQLAKKRQQLLDEYLESVRGPVVLVGNHREGKYVIRIPTQHRFMLDVDAKTSAKRALERSQGESPATRRTVEELPEDIAEAQADIDWLRSHRYRPMSAAAIEQWVTDHLEGTGDVEQHAKVPDPPPALPSPDVPPSPPATPHSRIAAAIAHLHARGRPDLAQRVAILYAKKDDKRVALPQVSRETFGYAEAPAGQRVEHFAQCDTCSSFSGKSCRHFSPDDAVIAGGTCDYYTYGEPDEGIAGNETSSVTPEEAGYVEAEVTCLRCGRASNHGKHCGLFEKVGADTAVRGDQSCCNAWQAKEGQEAEQYAKGGWNESQHPRGQPDNAGQFTSGGDSGGSVATDNEPKAVHAPRQEPSSPDVTHAEPTSPPSRAKVVNRNLLANRFKVNRLVKDFFGGNRQAVASCLGAPDDSTVEIDAGEDGKSLIARIRHESFAGPATRIFKRDSQGTLFCKNEFVERKPEYQGGGEGTEMFNRQVEHCRKHNVQYIRMHAAKVGRSGKKEFSGYYSWARMGVNQPLMGEGIGYELHEDKETARIAAEKFNAKTLRDVMRAPGGREWWQNNGFGLTQAVFECDPRSEHSKELATYLVYSRAKHGKRAEKNRA